MDVIINHDKEEQVFFADLGGQQAQLTYELPEDNVIDFTYTFVPQQMRGNGIGEQLVEAGLAYARENNYRIIPSCSFVARFVHRQHR